MTIAATALSLDHLLAHLDAFLPQGQESLLRGLIAEHLRTAVMGAGEAGISSARLTGAVRRNLYAVGAAVESEKVLGVLKDLRDIGDVADIDGGRWIATPARAIVLADDVPILAVGAWPPAAPFLNVVGVGRYLTDQRSKALAHPLITSVNSWLGSVDSLADWTQRFMTVRGRELADVNTSARDLESYAPDHFKAIGKLGRWIALDGITAPPEGLRLCRPRLERSRQFDRPYFLCTLGIVSSEVIVRKSIQVDYASTRRLRYGLDVRLDARRTLSATELDEGITVDIPNDWPAEEGKALRLGAPLSSTSVVTSYQFPRVALHFLEMAARRLGVSISVKKAGAR
jgi:hypothetical protein